LLRVVLPAERLDSVGLHVQKLAVRVDSFGTKNA